MGRGLTIVLAISLALNVFMGGFLAGRIVRPADALRAASSDRPVADDRALQGAGRRNGPGLKATALLGDPRLLPPDARAAFRSAVQSSRAERQITRQARREQRRAIRRALTADPFDQAAARDALIALTALESDRERQAVDVLISVFAALSPEERASLVAAGEKRYRGVDRRQRRVDGDRRARDKPAGTQSDSP